MTTLANHLLTIQQRIYKRYEMNRYIEISLVVLITQLSYSQNQDSIIQLTPEIGDTLDSSEKEYYNLYSHYVRFQHLVVFSSGDSCMAIKITYIDSSEVQKIL